LVLESTGKISLKITRFFVGSDEKTNSSNVTLFVLSVAYLVLTNFATFVYAFSLYFNICGLRKGPGKLVMGVLESHGFFVSNKVGTLSELWTCMLSSTGTYT